MSFSFVEFKVKLIGAMTGYTGQQGAFAFENGVSVHKLHRNQAEVLSVIGLQCEAIDENGESVFEVIAGKVPMPDAALEEVREAFVASRKEKMEKEAMVIIAPTEPVLADIVNAESETQSSSDSDPEPESKQVTSFDLKYLEKVADESGLRGLRELGNRVGIKGKSIPEMIERLSKYKG